MMEKIVLFLPGWLLSHWERQWDVRQHWKLLRLRSGRRGPSHKVWPLTHVLWLLFLGNYLIIDFSVIDQSKSMIFIPIYARGGGGYCVHVSGLFFGHLEKTQALKNSKLKQNPEKTQAKSPINSKTGNSTWVQLPVKCPNPKFCLCLGSERFQVLLNHFC